MIRIADQAVVAQAARRSKLGVAALILAMAVVAVAVVGVRPASAATVVVNGSFESGDLGGWTVYVPEHGFAGAVASFEQSLPAEFGFPAKYVKFDPKDGAFFALLKTNGAGSYTTLSQTLTVEVGDKVSGWVFFNTRDFYYPPWNDDAEVYVYKGDLLVATPFYADVALVGDRGYTPWTYWSYTFPENGTYTVKARVANTHDAAYDSHLGLDGVVFTPANKPPTAIGGGPYNVPEGGSIQLSAALSSDPNNDPLTYSWDLDNDGIFETAGPNPTFSAAGLDGPSARTVVLKVCDPYGECDTDLAVVDVTNVAPTAHSNNPYYVDEGGSIVLNGTASDPGPDTLTYSWDLNNDGVFETAGPNPTFSAAGLDGPSTSTVVLKVCDDDGGCVTTTGNVNILNVAPIAHAGGPYSVDAGGSIVLNGTASDPGPDTLTYSWDLDNDGIFETAGPNPTFSAAGLGGPSTSTVVLKVCDDDGACATASATINIIVVAIAGDDEGDDEGKHKGDDKGKHKGDDKGKHKGKK